jgi:hypothetical protein
LRGSLAMSETAPETPWRPISAAPRDGTRILLYATLRPLHEERFYTIGYFDPGLGWIADSPVRQVTSGLIQIVPTHWTPLPRASQIDKVKLLPDAGLFGRRPNAYRLAVFVNRGLGCGADRSIGRVVLVGNDMRPCA